MVNLNYMAEEAYRIAKKRESNGANIKTDIMSMLKHCAGEVIEATEAYCYEDEHFPHSFEEFEDEVADIIVCCLILSIGRDFDIEEALCRVMKKNRQRAERQGDKL